MAEKNLQLICYSQTKMETFQKVLAKSKDFIFYKLNLTSFEQERKLSHYLRLKITLKILVVSFTKEFVETQQ